MREISSAPTTSLETFDDELDLDLENETPSGDTEAAFFSPARARATRIIRLTSKLRKISRIHTRVILERGTLHIYCNFA